MATIMPCYGMHGLYGNECHLCPQSSACQTMPKQIDSADRHHRKTDWPLPLETSDGSTASYYELPEGSTELQHLISHRDMNAQIGEIFRACYRYGQVAHSPKLRDIKKIIFYAQAELARLESLERKHDNQEKAQGDSSTAKAS